MAAWQTRLLPVSGSVFRPAGSDHAAGTHDRRDRQHPAAGGAAWQPLTG
jgi:hypothetical protein